MTGALKVLTAPGVWTTIGGGSFATDAETVAGVLDDRAVTPAGLSAALAEVEATIPVLPPTTFVDVRSYGAVGDGTTDDRVAIQAAIDACGAAGGGTVFFPPGTYRLASSSTGFGFLWALSIPWDNIQLCGTGTASKIFNDQGGIVAMFTYGGACKAARLAGNVNNWGGCRVFVGSTPPPSYNLTGTTVEGAMSITTATPAHAGNFVAGDDIAIATGQTISSSASGQPDAEFNVVKSVNATTGVIDLREPTMKPYQAENYLTGSTGISAVGGAGTAAPYRVFKMTGFLTRGLIIRDLALETRSNRQLMLGGQMCNLLFENLDVLMRGGCSFTARETVKGEVMRRCRFDHQALSGWQLCMGVDAGSSQAIFEDIDITTDSGVPYLHIQEGPVDVRLSGVTVRGPDVAGNYPTLTIQNRAYHVMVDRCRFTGGGNTSIILVNSGQPYGGVIRDCRIRAGLANTALLVQSAGWMVRDIDCGSMLILRSESTANQTTGSIIAERMTGWVADDRQNPIIGVIPAYSMILNAYIYVQEAFNSSGTDLLTVGLDASVDNVAAAVDVSTTGIKPVTLGWLARWYIPTNETIKAFYVNGGSEPTTGKALVIVEYQRIPAAIA